MSERQSQHREDQESDLEKLSGSDLPGVPAERGDDSSGRETSTAKAADFVARRARSLAGPIRTAAPWGSFDTEWQQINRWDDEIRAAAAVRRRVRADQGPHRHRVSGQRGGRSEQPVERSELRPDAGRPVRGRVGRVAPGRLPSRGSQPQATPRGRSSPTPGSTFGLGPTSSRSSTTTTAIGTRRRVPFSSGIQTGSAATGSTGSKDASTGQALRGLNEESANAGPESDFDAGDRSPCQDNWDTYWSDCRPILPCTRRRPSSAATAYTGPAQGRDQR